VRQGFEQPEPPLAAAIEANIRTLAHFRDDLARLQRVEEAAQLRVAAGAATDAPPPAP
jgi:hypothetical protein